MHMQRGGTCSEEAMQVQRGGKCKCRKEAHESAERRHMQVQRGGTCSEEAMQLQRGGTCREEAYASANELKKIFSAIYAFCSL